MGIGKGDNGEIEEWEIPSWGGKQREEERVCNVEKESGMEKGRRRRRPMWRSLGG